MSYKVSYDVDMSHKYQYLNVEYDHSTQTPLGFFPLELSNLDNIKPTSAPLKLMNEFTSRAGALLSIPITLIDILISCFVLGIFSTMSKKEDARIHTRNRIYANLCVLGIASIRVLCAARLLKVEDNLDNYLVKYMKDTSNCDKSYWSREPGCPLSVTSAADAETSSEA